MAGAFPRSRKGQERREQILSAAMEAFASQGSRSVSMATIASRLGITEQAIMHYFPTKAHLLLGVLQRRDERDLAMAAELQAQGKGMVEILLAFMRQNSAQEGLATLYSVLMAESVDRAHPAHLWFAERNERFRAALSAGVRQAQGDGTMRPDVDPDAVAAQVLALYDGLALQRALADGTVDMVSIFEDYFRALERPPPGAR